MNPRFILGCVGLVVVLMVVSGAAQADWKFSGFTQARYNLWDDDADEDDAFDLRRVRAKFEGGITENTIFKLQLDFSELDETGDGEVVLKDAVILRKFSPQWNGSLGFTVPPLGPDLTISSSRRLPFERARITRLFFPGERDLGVYANYVPVNTGTPQISFGFSNGSVDWYDDDRQGDAEAFAGRLQWCLNKDSAVGAFARFSNREYDADDDPATPNVDFDDDVFGLFARYQFPKHFAVQAEYMDGQILDEDVNGWYFLGEYAFDKCPATAFYRFDTADRDSQPNEYARHTVGFAYDVSKNDRITVQAEMLEGFDGVDETNFGIQYQVKY